MLLSALCALWLPAAQATTWDWFGYGGGKLGRAGAGMALPEGLDSVVANPATLPGLPHGEVGVGLVLGKMSFAPYPALYWDTNADGRVDEADPPLDLQPDYEPVAGVNIGLVQRFGDHLAGGFAAYVPTQRLMLIESFEPSLPEYFLYANRAQRYDMQVALAGRPGLGIGIGAGLQIIPRAKFRLDGTLTALVQPAEEGDDAEDLLDLTLDMHTIGLDVVPGLAPNVSLAWDAGQAIPLLDGLYLGGSWRGEGGLPIDVDVNLQMNVGTADMGSLESTTLPLLLALKLGLYDHYLPSQLNLGASYRIQKVLTLSVDTRRTAWNRMQFNITRVLDVSLDGASMELSDGFVKDGNPYAITMRPTWAVRSGAELAMPPFRTGGRFGDVQLSARGGFGVEPSPLVDQGGDTALLDGNRTFFGFGLGVGHDDPFSVAEAHRVHFDTWMQYHLVASGQLERPPIDAPTAGYAVDGSPIPIGGHIWAGGATWRTEF